MDPLQIARELTELRRGRGMDSDDVHERVGPGLRELCGVPDSDQPAVVRRKLVLRLSTTVHRLPPDLALAAAWALALHEEATDQFLDRRIARLAEQFDRDPRTVRRRIDQSFRLIAQYLLEEPVPDPDPTPAARDSWRVLELDARLRLDRELPELVERRRIIATADEVDELELAFSAPRGVGIPAEQRIEVVALQGGEIVERIDVSGSHTRFVLRLPTPLRLGQQHEYTVRVTSWARAAMRPYYVLSPLRATTAFALRVTFDTARPPAAVWVLSGVPPRAVDDAVPSAELVEPDAVGEVAVEFHELRLGLSYGLQWTP